MPQVKLMSLALVEVQNLDKPRDLYHPWPVSKQNVALTAMLFRAVADQPQCKVPEGYTAGLNLWGAYATDKAGATKMTSSRDDESDVVGRMVIVLLKADISNPRTNRESLFLLLKRMTLNTTPERMVARIDLVRFRADTMVIQVANGSKLRLIGHVEYYCTVAGVQEIVEAHIVPGDMNYSTILGSPWWPKAPGLGLSRRNIRQANKKCHRSTRDYLLSPAPDDLSW